MQARLNGYIIIRLTFECVLRDSFPPCSRPDREILHARCNPECNSRPLDKPNFLCLCFKAGICKVAHMYCATIRISVNLTLSQAHFGLNWVKSRAKQASGRPKYSFSMILTQMRGSKQLQISRPLGPHCASPLLIILVMTAPSREIGRAHV